MMPAAFLVFVKSILESSHVWRPMEYVGSVQPPPPSIVGFSFVSGPSNLLRTYSELPKNSGTRTIHTSRETFISMRTSHEKRREMRTNEGKANVQEPHCSQAAIIWHRYHLLEPLRILTARGF